MSVFPSIDAAVGRRLLDAVHGCTFDDFILSPQRSVLERRDPTTIDLASPLTRRLTLKRPIVSANMDTVTRAPMAIVQAEEGRRLAGLLTERDMRFVGRRGSRVSDRMTPVAQLVVHEGPLDPDAAER